MSRRVTFALLLIGIVVSVLTAACATAVPLLGNEASKLINEAKALASSEGELGKPAEETVSEEPAVEPVDEAAGVLADLQEQADNVEVITREYVDDTCPDPNELLGNESVVLRRVDTILNDILSKAEDGCGWRIFNFTETSQLLHLPEGVILNKPPKTYGPANIFTRHEPVTLWQPVYDPDDESSCRPPTELAIGTEESDWIRKDSNLDGQIRIKDDWCGYELASWETKNLNFRIPEGVEADQSLVVTGPIDYETNRLEATIWITDEYLDVYTADQ